MTRTHIEARLKALAAEQQKLPGMFEDAKTQTAKEVEAILLEAGVLARVRALEAKLEALRVTLQKEADTNIGRISELHSLWEQLGAPPAPPAAEVPPNAAPGYPFPTEMFGVDLRPLDEQTRWAVMAGKREIIEALGGKPPLGSPCVVADQTP